VISWPARIKDKGGIAPSSTTSSTSRRPILEAAGVRAPSVLNGVPQKPIEGVSMVYTFDDAKAPSKHRTQYFEMFANRAIYNDGWVAATTPPLAPWAVGKTIDVGRLQVGTLRPLQDFSEANNLAAKEPEKLRELQELFWIEAAKYNVLPLDNSKIERPGQAPIAPASPGALPLHLLPRHDAHSRRQRAGHQEQVLQDRRRGNIPDGGADGVLVTQGGRFNGWALYLLEGKPVFHYNLIGKYRSSIAGKDKLAPATTSSSWTSSTTARARQRRPVTLTVDDKPAASGKLERTVPLLFSADETLDIGEDTGTPASEDYHVPFKFTGDLKKVMIELSDNKLTPAEEEELKKARESIGVTD
jgi:arylsulfatase